MNFEEYQVSAAAIWDRTRLDDPVIGLAGEVGEVLELIKKDRRPGEFRKKLDRDKLVKELGDVLYYLTITAEENDIDLEECAVGNIGKLSERYKDIL
jgi:NTP pyrophosphatase (non-canonical NTP hydrolase)